MAQITKTLHNNGCQYGKINEGLHKNRCLQHQSDFKIKCLFPLEHNIQNIIKIAQVITKLIYDKLNY